MWNNLENKINNNIPPYKSQGEKKIAEFLSQYPLRFNYESGVMVYPEASQPRIWYPDFYLPDLGIYIEYYGIKGDKNYDQGISFKEKVYAKQNLPVIPIYPWMFQEDWQGYTFRKIESLTKRRYDLGKNLYLQTTKRAYGQRPLPNKRYHHL